MLSRTAEHALRAVLFLARSEPGERVPVARIATALGAPQNYMGKTLQALVGAGLLESTRGPGGGFRLVRSPEVLTVADLAGAVEGRRGSGMCLMGGRRCSSATPCGAHERWQAVQRAAAAPLRRTTIADLMGNGTVRARTGSIRPGR